MFSIIIPTYNRASVINETIESVLNQDYPEWEVLIIDDHSTDNTEEIIRPYSEKDARIKFIKNTEGKKGACSCRNLGIELSSGDYLIFLDSDDQLLPSTLSGRRRLIKEETNLDFIVTRGVAFSDGINNPEVYWNIKSTIPDIERFLNFDGPWQTTGVTWKKKSLSERGLKWDEGLSLWQDIDFHVQAIITGLNYKIYWHHPFDYGVRRTSKDSISRVGFYNKSKSSSKLRLWNKCLNELTNKNIEENVLLPLMLSVSGHFAINREWDTAREVIQSAYNHQIISAKDYRKLRKNLLLTRCSFNRVNFPLKFISGPFNIPETTIQKIPVDVG